MVLMQETIDIRDPIHGYIRLTPLEMAVMDSPPLQRLRHIRQLGLTDLVYPGATHNRFAHSLGTLHVAGRVLDHLFQQSPASLLPPEKKRDRIRQLVRIAALVHDTGHSPFSHALEGLFPAGYHHERMALELIRHSELGTILNEHAGETGITPDDVVRVIRGDLPEGLSFLHSMISGELDVDKMDYLLRDSHYCGVTYGHYDLERLLYTLTLLPGPEGPRIGVLEGGIHALEAFVLARYYMFTQVYFNPTSKILEMHLDQFLRDRDVRWDVEVAPFLLSDDDRVRSLLKEGSDHFHARQVLSRSHYPLAYETDEHMDDEQEERFTGMFDRISEEYPKGTIFLSNATKDPHRFSETRVRVRMWNDSLLEVTERSSFIGKLKRINQYRVYVPREFVEEVKRKFTAAASGDA